MRCRLGQALDFVGARCSSLAERFYNIMCHVRGVEEIGVCRGAVVAQLVWELGPVAAYGRSSALPDEGLEEMLDCFDEATSCVVDRLSVGDIVCSVH